MDDRPDVALTKHARDRCNEMGVPYEVAKAVLRNPTMTWAANPPGRFFAWSQENPGIGVYFSPDEFGTKIAITVVPRTYDTYTRTESA